MNAEGPDPQLILDRLLARSEASGCRYSSRDRSMYSRTVEAQDAIETGSQVVGADDEYA